jgi:hypothetical protein
MDMATHQPKGDTMDDKARAQCQGAMDDMQKALDAIKAMQAILKVKKATREYTQVIAKELSKEIA